MAVVDGIVRSIERKKNIVLGAIILLGLLLRVYQLDFQSLWLDELHSVIGASPERTTAEVIQYAKSDQPPFYFILLHFWMNVFGDTGYFARLLSVVFGVFAILMIYILGRRFRGTTVGLALALMLAVNFHGIYFSQEARFYSLFLLLSLLTYYFFLEVLTKGKAHRYFFFGLVSVLNAYTHYFGLVVFASQIVTTIILLLLKLVDRKRVFGLGVSFILIFLAILPWGPVFLQDMSIKEFWIPPVRIWFFGSFIIQFFKAPMTIVIIVLVLGAGGINYFRKVAKGSVTIDLYLIVVLLWLGLGLLIPFTYSMVRVPILISRYCTFVLPALMILFIEFGCYLTPIKNRVIGIGAVAVSSIAFLFVGGYYYRVEKQQFREAASRLAELNKSRHPVISDHAWHFNYYLQRMNSIKALHPWDVLQPEFFRSDTIFFLHIDQFDMKFEQNLVEEGYVNIRRESFHAAGIAIYQLEN